MNPNEFYEFILSLEKQAIPVNELQFITDSFANSPYFKKEAGRVVKTSFNSLIGNYGILPEQYSKSAYYQLSLKERALVSFYEIFNNRFLKLFYEFHKLARLDRLEENFPNKNLLCLLNFQAGPYYGHLSSFRLRSKSALAKFITHYFGVSCYEITTRALKIKLPEHQACKLSTRLHFNQLGRNALLGLNTTSLTQQWIIDLEISNSDFFRSVPELIRFIKEYTLNDCFFKLRFRMASGLFVDSRTPVYLGWNGLLGGIARLD